MKVQGFFQCCQKVSCFFSTGLRYKVLLLPQLRPLIHILAIRTRALGPSEIIRGDLALSLTSALGEYIDTVAYLALHRYIILYNIGLLSPIVAAVAKGLRP